MGGNRRQQLVLAATFLAPALVFLGAIVVYPAMATAVRSLYDRAGDTFVGLDNYETMFQLGRMRRAIINSFIWVAAFPIIVVTVGLMLAVLSERIPWKTAFKTILFLPMAISLLASGIIWRIVYEDDPDRGAINALLNIPRSLVLPEGEYAGAVPSLDDTQVDADNAVTAEVNVDAGGGVIRLGLLRIATDQVPEGATQARAPPAADNTLSGVVWRDIKPGDDVKGEVEEDESGLPGVSIEVLDERGDVVGEATTAADGTFVIEGLEPGTYRVRIPGSVFRTEWSGIAWLGPSLITPAAIIAGVWVWAGLPW